MGKIYALMGKSSCGKDTIFKELMNDKALSLQPIITYTTRPRRVTETQGVEYNFIGEDILKEYIMQGKVIEKREYDTVYGKWYYCTIDDGKVDLSQNNYLLIATLEAYRDLRKYYGESSIIPIYISVDDGVRLERAIKREREQVNPNFDEVCRRFLADNVDFSKQNLDLCGIEKHYINNNFNECINNIKIDLFRKK
ncbi:guanylate kinase [Inconstantimicrobium mannanitabidum]|uniref:Guanylate kinase n=1 Tax=Inconstantimicrobium mannanitabidum TaxID=1604901 RepID=A0ACB5RI50_9CLOT|nr:guanylate kinase [Clostridium sp. TW13]GKX68752.1 guanylate kinase [Clostridium sp. TW13]